MTRYDPKTLRGDFLGMEPHPTGDYVRYEVAQALRDSVIGLLVNSDEYEPEDREGIPTGRDVCPECNHNPHLKGCRTASLFIGARAALALAEKKDT